MQMVQMRYHGLGLRLHYDSSVVEMGEVAILLDEGASGNPD